MNPNNPNNPKSFSGYTRIISDSIIPCLNIDTELKNLTIFCGRNGTGKSFSMKLIWVTNAITAMEIMQKFTNIPILNNKNTQQVFQLLMDNVFTDQKFTGKYVFTGEDSDLKFEIKNGVITNFKLNVVDNLVAHIPIYLSKEVRGFGILERYTKTLKLMQLKIQTLEDVLKMKDFFKVYDVFSIELLLSKFDKVSELLQQIPKDLLDGLDIVSLENNDGIYYTDSKGKKKSALTLGDGHQAILVMLLANF